MEGDGQVGGGGGELEGAAASDVPPQDPGRDLIAVGDGQHVAVADVESEDERQTETERERERDIQWYQLSASCDDSERRLCGRRDDLRG